MSEYGETLENIEKTSKIKTIKIISWMADRWNSTYVDLLFLLFDIHRRNIV